MEWRGKPGTIRVDNGPEYISGKLLIWAEKRGITIQHIQPGQPQQNAYIERYNRTFRHEWLDQSIIETIEEAQDCATQWLWTYNNDRRTWASAASHPPRSQRWSREFYRCTPLRMGGLLMPLEAGLFAPGAETRAGSGSVRRLCTGGESFTLPLSRS